MNPPNLFTSIWSQANEFNALKKSRVTSSDSLRLEKEYQVKNCSVKVNMCAITKVRSSRKKAASPEYGYVAKVTIAKNAIDEEEKEPNCLDVFLNSLGIAYQPLDEVDEVRDGVIEIVSQLSDEKDGKKCQAFDKLIINDVEVEQMSLKG